MESFAEDRLRRIRASLASIVLLVEDGDVVVTPEAAREMQVIFEYIKRIGEAVGKSVRV